MSATIPREIGNGHKLTKMNPIPNANPTPSLQPIMPVNKQTNKQTNSNPNPLALVLALL